MGLKDKFKEFWDALGPDNDLGDPKMAADLAKLEATQNRMFEERQSVSPRVDVPGKVKLGTKKGRGGRGSSTREHEEDEGKTMEV